MKKKRQRKNSRCTQAIWVIEYRYGKSWVFEDENFYYTKEAAEKQVELWSGDDSHRVVKFVRKGR